MGNHVNRVWTEERRNAVAAFLQEGLSASEIGSRLSVSRNAVIGVIHRDSRLSEIGLAGTVGGARTPKAASSPYKSGRVKTAARRSPARTVSIQPAETAAPAVEPEPAFVCEELPDFDNDAAVEALNLPLTDLSRHQCRFAVNNAAKGEQHLFCGHPVKIGSSFCEHHHRRVFVRPLKAGAV
ncbi:GcrA family cell cycle regulator [Brucella intermedia]|uniref:GcrA family cell cycle regulator n=1 Tax=Brucella intermedia TaxID=94625 RepID=UPI003AB538C8